MADRQIIATEIEEGSDYQDDIGQLEAELAGLSWRDPGYDARHAAILAELAELDARDPEPDRAVPRPLGVTVGEHWKTLGKAGKRAYLVDTGVRIYLDRGGSPDMAIVGDLTRIGERSPGRASRYHRGVCRLPASGQGAASGPPSRFRLADRPCRCQCKAHGFLKTRSARTC